MSNTRQINSTVTEDDVLAIARSVHNVRPDWHPQSLVTLLGELASRAPDARTLRKAAITAAEVRSNKTPRSIEWALDNLAFGGNLRTEPCAVCGKSEDRCAVRPYVADPELRDDHAYITRGQKAALIADEKKNGSNERRRP